MLEFIDLSVFPNTCFHSPGTVVTIGDLHANPILLIYFLQKNGIISISQNKYEELYALYQKIAEYQADCRNIWTPLLENYYRLFLKILDDIAVNPCSIKIRFLGDELADRGECDLFIMIIFNKLHLNNIDFNILVSNHGMAFLSSLQYILYQTWQDSAKMALHPEDMPSFLGLQKLFFHQFVSTKWLKNWLKTVYLPHLDLLDYSVSDDLSRFYIFTHAAMGLNQLQALADEYQVNWGDDNIHELASSLKNMKKIFQEQKLNELLDLFKNHALDPEERLIQKHLLDTVFWRDLIWNRAYETTRPFKAHPYLVYNVHGHDQGCKENHDYFISLDGYLGKYYQITRGYMKTLVMQEEKILAKKKTENNANYFTFFQPLVYCMPSLNQSLLLLGLGYVFKSKFSLNNIIPFFDYILEQWPNTSKFKLVKN